MPIDPLEPRRLLSGITLTGSPTPITTLPNSLVTYGSVTLAGGKIVVAYPKNNELFAKVISPDGSTSAEVMLSSTTVDGRVGRFRKPALAASADGLSFFAAYDAENGSDIADIFLGKYNADLSTLIAPACVNGAGGLAGSQLTPALCVSGASVAVAYENTPPNANFDTRMNAGVFDANTLATIAVPVTISPATESGEAGGGRLDRAAQVVPAGTGFQCFFLRQTFTAQHAFENQSHQVVPVGSGGTVGAAVAAYRFGYNGHTLGVPHVTVIGGTAFDVFDETSFEAANPLNYVGSGLFEIHAGNGVNFSTPSALATTGPEAQYGVSDLLEVDRPADATPFLDVAVTAGTHGGNGNEPASLRSILFNPATGTVASNDFVTNISLDVTIRPFVLGNPQITIFEPSPGTGASGVSVVGQPGLVTFPDPVAPNYVSIAPLHRDEPVAEGGGGATHQYAYIVSLTSPATVATSVDVKTGTVAGQPLDLATPGADFTAIDALVVFAVGEQQETVMLTVVDDNIHEHAEGLKIALSNPQHATLATPSVANVEIIDNDAVPMVEIDVDEGPPTREGDPGHNGFATAVFRLDRPSSEDVMVRVTTRDATVTPVATPGSDYEPVDAVITIPAGSLTATRDIAFVADLVPEPAENFAAYLSFPVNAVLGEFGSALFTIVDDDPPTPAVSIALVDGQDELEGLAGFAGSKTYVISLSNASKLPAVARVSTTQVSGISASLIAIADTDFVPLDQELTFAPGDTTMQVKVTFVGDLDLEEDELFRVNVVAVSGATTGAADHVLTRILNDDAAPPTVTISEADHQTRLEGSAATPGEEHFKVRLSGKAPGGANVRVRTFDLADVDLTHRALADGDYVPLDTIVSFGPDDLEMDVTVRLVGDALLENSEAFLLQLGEPHGAQTVDGADDITALIVDDDAAPAGPYLRFTAVEATPLGKGKVRFDLTIKNVGQETSSGKTLLTVLASADLLYTTAVDVKVASGIATLALAPNQETKISLIGTQALSADLLASETASFVARLLVQKTGQSDDSASAYLSGVTTVTPGTPVRLVDPATGKPSGTITVKSGTVTVTPRGDGTVDINVTGDGSDVSVNTNRGQPSIPVGDLTILGKAKSFVGKGVEIFRDISLATVQFLFVGDIKDDHHITISGPVTTPATITLGAVANTTLTSTQPIKSLTVASWTDDDGSPDLITAPSIDALTCAGAFEAGMTIAGTVKALTVAGTLGGTLTSTLAAANFGKVTVGSIRNTHLFAGVAGNALPTSAADFASAPSAIAAFTMKSPAPPGFSNTFIAARSLGPVSLLGVTPSNPTPFGIAAVSIKSYSRDKAKKPISDTPGLIDSVGDFSVKTLS